MGFARMRSWSERDRDEAGVDAPVPLGPSATAATPTTGPGNRASIAVQAKLDVGPVDDPMEREADRVADQVMRVIAGRTGAEDSPPSPERVARTPSRIDRAELTGAAGAGGGRLDAGTESEIVRSAGGGRGLEPSTRASFEQAFGADFGGVRIHADSELAPQLGAQAFTHGRDVHFAPGAYQPGTAGGQRLLAHELTHVVQQSGSAQRSPAATIRRMPPSRLTITDKSNLGPPKEDSTKYRAVLTAIDAFYQFVDTETLKTRDGVFTQLETLLGHYNTLITALSAYDGKIKTGHAKKYQYFQTLKMRMQNEKGQAIRAMTRWAADPNRPGKISQVLGGAIVLNASGKMDEKKHTGEVGGGMNKLQVYDDGSGGSQYFKENTESFDVFTGTEEQDEDVRTSALHERADKMKAGKGKDKATAKAKAERKDFDTKQTRTMVVEDAAIAPDDARSSSREVASYRLDQLLGADIIARAEFAVRKGGKTLGTIQQGAPGTKLVELANQRLLDTDDPGLARQLSKLQLLDAIAFQVDRNKSNMFLQRDGAGRIVGITGIDNDMAFGTRGTLGRRQEFPGLAQYFDREMANKVIELAGKEPLVRAAFADLLTADEITALIARLRLLAAHLQQLAADNKLLAPDEWDAALDALAQDTGNYYSSLVGWEG